jgi:hypothetical protein
LRSWPARSAPGSAAMDALKSAWRRVVLRQPQQLYSLAVRAAAALRASACDAAFWRRQRARDAAHAVLTRCATRLRSGAGRRRAGGRGGQRRAQVEGACGRCGRCQAGRCTWRVVALVHPPRGDPVAAALPLAEGRAQAESFHGARIRLPPLGQAVQHSGACVSAAGQVSAALEGGQVGHAGAGRAQQRGERGGGAGGARSV